MSRNLWRQVQTRKGQWLGHGSLTIIEGSAEGRENQEVGECTTFRILGTIKQDVYGERYYRGEELGAR